MRLFFFALLFAASALNARAESPVDDTEFNGVPPLLRAAFLRYAAEADHWAYTEHSTSKDRKGRVKDEQVTRYDPSQPYDVQWTLLKIAGKDPTESQMVKFRKQRTKNRAKRRTLGELLNLPGAVVAEETATSVVFEVPLIKDDNQQLPPEKFRVTVRVNKEQPALERIEVRVRAAMRVALVAKIKSGDAVIEFSRVDPKFPPAITAIHADGAGSIMFVPLGGAFENVRSDFKRVTPYSDRFKVKVGPLRTIDF